MQIFFWHFEEKKIFQDHFHHFTYLWCKNKNDNVQEETPKYYFWKAWDFLLAYQF